MTAHRRPRSAPRRRAAVPPPDRRQGRAADRRRRRRHLRRPDELARGLPLQAGPGAHPAPAVDGRRRAPVVLDLRARWARRRGSACARCPAGSSPPGWSTRCSPATRSRCCRRRARSPPISRSPGDHVFVVAGSGITPVLSLAGTVLAGTATARVTVFYGNRRTNTVMFADELADLKDRYGPRLQLVHVLSREPQRRRADQRPARRATGCARWSERLVDAPTSTTGGCAGRYGMVEDARAAARPGSACRREKVHQELFYVDDPPPEPVRRDEETRHAGRAAR